MLTRTSIWDMVCMEVILHDLPRKAYCQLPRLHINKEVIHVRVLVRVRSGIKAPLRLTNTIGSILVCLDHVLESTSAVGQSVQQTNNHCRARFRRRLAS